VEQNTHLIFYTNPNNPSTKLGKAAAAARSNPLAETDDSINYWFLFSKAKNEM
jgi:histidinol-phosphate/aromatic aminotransferase/cobyric acid decarboxylase-like protein